MRQRDRCGIPVVYRSNVKITRGITGRCLHLPAEQTFPAVQWDHSALCRHYRSPSCTRTVQTSPSVQELIGACNSTTDIIIISIKQQQLLLLLLGSRSLLHENIKFVYPLSNAQFLLLSTNLAWKQLQTDRLTAYPNNLPTLFLETCMNIADRERPWKPKQSILENSLQLHAATQFKNWILEILEFRKYWRQTKTTCTTCLGSIRSGFLF